MQQSITAYSFWGPGKSPLACLLRTCSNLSDADRTACYKVCFGSRATQMLQLMYNGQLFER